MDAKMIAIVRIALIILIVLLLYLVNTPSNGDPSVILFKLIFCGGIGLVAVIFWIKSEYMRSESKREENNYNNYNKDEIQKDKEIYLVQPEGNKIKNFILILAAIATIITAILTLLK